MKVLLLILGGKMNVADGEAACSSEEAASV